MAGGERHRNEANLMKFLERQEQSSDYIFRTAEWLKVKYPGSAAALLPKLRKLYKDKRAAGL